MKDTPLQNNEIHLWYHKLENLNDADLIKAYWALLNPEEQAKYQTFIHLGKKTEYLTTRILVRKTLSQYIDYQPGQLQFSENSNGRPEISHPKIDMPLRFNISHTFGLVVVAVALDCELGVDVEFIKRTDDLTSLAEHNFSDPEVMALKKLGEEAQVGRFFEIWTLKEAYIKARGKGLSLPL